MFVFGFIFGVLWCWTGFISNAFWDIRISRSSNGEYRLDASELWEFLIIAASGPAVFVGGYFTVREFGYNFFGNRIAK